ncbi:MAG TPA: PrsW family glutamic-type intramembrane protease [Bacteroidales bacterium]|nr:PrsW family glutamic-type intramembrane protease [Bacteroidales bacterium]
MLPLIGIATVPVILILFYVWFRDKYDREPWWMLLISFAGGAATVPVIIWWETIMMRLTEYFYTFEWQHAFVNSFLVAGLCEESMKLIALLLIVWRSNYFNEKFDGILYAVFVSLGFALVENIMYVTGNGHQVGITRALTAVPAHAVFGITMGFYLARAKFTSRGKWHKLLRAWYIPIILHGTYNYILMATSNYLLLSFVLYVGLLYLLGYKEMRVSSLGSIFRK